MKKKRSTNNEAVLTIIAYTIGVEGRIIPQHQNFGVCSLYLGFIDENMRK